MLNIQNPLRDISNFLDAYSLMKNGFVYRFVDAPDASAKLEQAYDVLFDDLLGGKSDSLLDY